MGDFRFVIMEVQKLGSKLLKFKKFKNGDIRKKPISRADFEPVASQKCPDFIGPKNRRVRDLLIAPIKTGTYWEATRSKSALKSAQKRLVSSSTCSNFVILKSRFWGCCFSEVPRFYWPKKFSSTRYTVLANKIDDLLRSNMLKSGPQKWPKNH